MNQELKIKQIAFCGNTAFIIDEKGGLWSIDVDELNSGSDEWIPIEGPMIEVEDAIYLRPPALPPSGKGQQ